MNDLNSADMLILIIDDNPNNLSIITEHLEMNHLEVMVARDGEDGIIKAQKGSPDLILLDVMMPGLNGFETCALLKKDPRTDDIPVLFMTALDNVEDKLRGFEAGGLDYITKPFNEQEVLARVKVHLIIRKLQKDLEKKNRELESALEEIDTLRGIIPICSSCKKIRDDKGYWNQLEEYITRHSSAVFSHGLCPECARRLYPGLYKK